MPVIWRRTEAPDPDAGVRAPILGLRVAAAAAFVTALCGATAAAGEIWRFRLMLRGRTEVLDGMSVRTSDALVGLGSWLALGSAVVTAVIAAPVVVRAHRAAIAFAGRSVSRSPLNVWLRLLMPVWNSCGAGQILTETEALLTGRLSVGGRPRASRLLSWWWAVWLASSVLAIVTLARALGGSVQAVADTVELHIAVDVVAVAVAALFGVVLLRLARQFAPEPDGLAGWLVAEPAPTRTPVDDPAAARRRSGIVPPTGTGKDLEPGIPQPIATPPCTDSAAGDGGGKAARPAAPETGP